MTIDDNLPCQCKILIYIHFDHKNLSAHRFSKEKKKEKGKSAKIHYQMHVLDLSSREDFAFLRYCILSEVKDKMFYGLFIFILTIKIYLLADFQIFAGHIIFFILKY